MEHAKLSPSSAHRWIHCPGSVEASKDAPRSYNAAAELGTGAHALAEYTLRSDHSAVKETWLGQTFDFIFDRAKKSFIVTRDIIDNVNVYVRRVVEQVRKHPGAKLILEKRADLSHIQIGMFGHADTVIDAGSSVVLSDFKYGFVPVHLIGNPEALSGVEILPGDENLIEADVNEQLLCYVTGILQEMLWIPETAILEIVQPRSQDVEPVQSITLPASFVYNWSEKVLRPAAIRANDPKAQRVAGPWCRFCPAAAWPEPCPALVEQTERLAQIEFSDFAEINPPAPARELSHRRIAEILEWAPVIEAWFKIVRARAFGLLRSGEHVPGQKLIRGRGKRLWPFEDYVTGISQLSGAYFKEIGFVSNPAVFTDLSDQDQTIVKEFIKAATEPIQLRSPAQLEKEGPVFKKITEQFAEKHKGGLTLAPLSNRSPEVTDTTAADEFAEFAESEEDY